jgi:RNA polymerase sigma-B factor
MLRVRQATDALSERNGRAPTVSELCEETGLDAEQIADALQARSAKETTSFDRPTYGREDDLPTLGEMLGRDDAGFELVEDRVTVGPLLRSLPRRDREMLFMRFARDMTQSEIAERLGCSQMHVSRLLRDALDRLAERTDRQLAERG